MRKIDVEIDRDKQSNTETNRVGYKETKTEKEVGKELKSMRYFREEV